MMRKDTMQAMETIVEMSQRVNQWDEMPMLVVVSPRGIGLAALDGDIYEVLATAASKLKEQFTGVTGVVLMNEAWSLSADKVENLAAVRAELAATGRRFADHPAAVEVKVFTALDDEGMVIWQIERGNPEVQKDTAAGGGSVGGRMPATLKALLAELQS